MSNFSVPITTPPITRQELGAIFQNNPKVVRAFSDLLNDIRTTLPQSIVSVDGSAAAALAAAAAAQHTANQAEADAQTAITAAAAAQSTANSAAAGVTALKAVPFLLPAADSTVPDSLVLTAGANVTLVSGTGTLTLNVNSSAPSGPAGGDLSGNYPSPVVRSFSGTLFGSAAGHPATDFLAAANNLSDLASAATARGNLGLGSAALLAASAVLQAANNLSDLSSVATARTNLGLGTFATQSYATPPVIGGTTPNAISATTLVAQVATVDGPVTINNTTSGPTLIVNGSGSGGGAQMFLEGNGATTPNKTIAALGGALMVFNNAISAAILTLDDTGDLAVTGGLSFAPATTTAAPAAGGAGALPATPAGYMTVTVGGTARKVPYY